MTIRTRVAAIALGALMLLGVAPTAGAADQRNCFDHRGPSQVKWQAARSYAPGTLCLQDGHGYRLVWQADGNLVWYAGGNGATPVWASHTARQGRRLVLDTHGFVTVTGSGGRTLWTTYGRDNDHGRLQGDWHGYLTVSYLAPHHDLTNGDGADQAGDTFWEQRSDKRPSHEAPHRKPHDRPGCRRYQVLGLRGSGEAYAGPYRMGATVGLAAGYAVADLPKRSVRAFSIPYPALGVNTLIDRPARFFGSMLAGEHALGREVGRIATRCPHARIAIIGYSQGAGVASEGVRMMASRARSHIAALVLFADTYSRGDSSYSHTFDPFAQDQRGWKRKGHGIFGARSIPLAARKIADVCFDVDPVCVAGGTGTTIRNAMFAGVHTRYKSWDGNGIGPRLLPLLFGRFAASRLRGH